MTRKPSKRRAALAAVVAAAATAAIVHAQPPTPQAPPRYRVELIVFANDNFSPSEELFEPAAPAPLAVPDLRVFDDAWLLTQQGPAPAAGEPNAQPMPNPQPSGQAPALSPDGVAPPPAEPVAEPPFRPLAADELELTPQYQRLARSSNWRPILHGGWVQDVVTESRTEPVRLTALGVHNPAGTISLYRANFLHLRLDVIYERGGAGASFGAAAEPADATGTGNAPFGNRGAGGFSLEPFELAPRYRLEQSRQTRSGELQHFDHPAFGVLVKVTEIPRAPAPSGAPQRPEP